MIELRPETPADRAAVDALIERAFGPGRYAKAAERLREGNKPRLELSPTAWDGETLVGTVRLWPILIGEAPAMLLGPIAVEASHRGRRLGQALAADACLRATQAGGRLLLLVGEERLFGPLGFVRVEPGRVRMPGPVDPRRVFVRELRPGTFEDVSGEARLEPLS